MAAEAGVAANLITRYFGGKAGLFAAATSIDLQVRAVLPGPREELGRRIAQRVVERWESVDEADPLLMMLRSAGTSEEAAAGLADFFAVQAGAPMTGHLVTELGHSPEDAAAITASIAALLMGVITSRYVMRAQPLAGAERGPLTAWLADRLQRLLDGPPPPPLGPTRTGR